MINDRSNILKMNPRLDDDGLLRSDSRIINAELLPIAMRRPIIRPDSQIFPLEFRREGVENGEMTRA